MLAWHYRLWIYSNNWGKQVRHIISDPFFTLHLEFSSTISEYRWLVRDEAVMLLLGSAHEHLAVWCILVRKFDLTMKYTWLDLKLAKCAWALPSKSITVLIVIPQSAHSNTTMLDIVNDEQNKGFPSYQKPYYLTWPCHLYATSGPGLRGGYYSCCKTTGHNIFSTSL